MQRVLREVFYDVLGLEAEQSAVAWQDPPTDIVRAYMGGHSNVGPTVGNLRFTLEGPADNAWNRVVLAELASEAMRRQGAGKWTLGTGTHPEDVRLASWQYWEDNCLQKWNRVRGFWSNAQPKPVKDRITGESRLETSAERLARLKKDGEQLEVATRLRTRRYGVSVVLACIVMRLTLISQRFERRKKICKHKAETVATLEEQARWKKAGDAVVRLTASGMSSDESEVDEATHQYGLKASVLFWRRDLDSFLDAIDSYRYEDGGAFAAPGSVPQRRRRSSRSSASMVGHAVADGVRVSERKPVAGLPSSFYDQRWLAAQGKGWVNSVLSPLAAPWDWSEAMVPMAPPTSRRR